MSCRGKAPLATHVKEKQYKQPLYRSATWLWEVVGTHDDQQVHSFDKRWAGGYVHDTVAGDAQILQQSSNLIYMLLRTARQDETSAANFGCNSTDLFPASLFVRSPWLRLQNEPPSRSQCISNLCKQPFEALVPLIQVHPLGHTQAHDVIQRL